MEDLNNSFKEDNFWGILNNQEKEALKSDIWWYISSLSTLFWKDFFDKEEYEELILKLGEFQNKWNQYFNVYKAEKEESKSKSLESDMNNRDQNYNFLEK